MFSTLRTRFGIPGVISVIALVFAMFGGAYAASNSSDGGKATASAKAKKGPRGPKGPKGDTGPAGPQGPAGPAGAKGDTGTAGSSGANGKDGVGVTTAAASPAECPSGGTKFTSASGTSHVCNGEGGSGGGFPETLPSEKTETGIWGSGLQTPQGRHTFPISFPIPLEESPIPVIVGAEESSKPGCPGRGGGPLPPTGAYEPTIPEADPGRLCIYLNKVVEVSPPDVAISVKKASYEEGEWLLTSGVSQTGAYLELICLENNCQATGTWAVTAE
ncbi:MAG TPA: hypothetical protein VJQ84_08175 [Solirubrobacterales bacterium]|nr:hypothetical protein [Solirubrobacterales bacterium]